MPKLNLGCGNDIRPGWINLDRKGLPGVNVVHDLETLPLPFPADTFDYILCQDVLEHVDCVALLREILRIMRDASILHIRVPHFTCAHAYGDPTHKNFFTSDTFGFFVTAGSNRDYYFDFAFSRMANLRIHFGPKAFRPIEYAVNLNRKMQRFYEASPLRIFPASNLEVDLIK
jgi:ubiquinone/menaquinone biosynthesis C-methylase UbiE